MKKLFQHKKSNKDKLEQYLIYEHSFYQLKRITHGYNMRILLHAFENIQVCFKKFKNLQNEKTLVLRRIIREAEKRWKLVIYDILLKWKRQIMMKSKIAKNQATKFINITLRNLIKSRIKIGFLCLKQNFDEIRIQINNNLVIDNQQKSRAVIRIFEITNYLMQNNLNEIVKKYHKYTQSGHQKIFKQKAMTLTSAIKNFITNIRRKYMMKIKIYAKEKARFELIFDKIHNKFKEKLKNSWNEIKEYTFKKERILKLKDIIEMISGKIDENLIYSLVEIYNYSNHYELILKTKYISLIKKLELIVTNLILRKKRTYIKYFFEKMNKDSFEKSLKLSSFIKLIDLKVQKMLTLAFTILKTDSDIKSKIENSHRKFKDSEKLVQSSQKKLKLQKTMVAFNFIGRVKTLFLTLSVIINRYNYNLMCTGLNCIKAQNKYYSEAFTKFTKILNTFCLVIRNKMNHSNMYFIGHSFEKLKSTSKMMIKENMIKIENEKSALKLFDAVEKIFYNKRIIILNQSFQEIMHKHIIGVKIHQTIFKMIKIFIKYYQLALSSAFM